MLIVFTVLSQIPALNSLSIHNKHVGQEEDSREDECATIYESTNFKKREGRKPVNYPRENGSLPWEIATNKDTKSKQVLIYRKKSTVRLQTNFIRYNQIATKQANTPVVQRNKKYQ